ncbi:MAG: WD40 domain-containing protein, partial [Planctomycetota bacterium]
MIERVEAVTSSWADGKAEFTLSVAAGRDNEPFIATITIANLTDTALSFPKPMVMPLAGDTNKNNIRVYDSFGERLEMTGVHADFSRHPFTEIAPHSSESWQFTLEENFPGLSEPGRYKVEMWYFCDGGNPAAWTGRVRMEPILIERGPVPDGGTGPQGYLAPGSSVATTNDYESIIISGINLQFGVPQRWTTWYNEFKDNFHLSRQELDSVMQAEGEWDFEFATLVNSILPFQGCAAHVGGESWGKNSISFADVQLRAYLLAGGPEGIEDAVRAMSTQRPSSIFGRGHATYDESFRLEQDSGSLWRKTRISYGAAYGDYGSTAHIDFRLRQFGSTAAAFVFMYTDHKDQQGTINQILGSVVCPYDSETVDTGEQTDPQAAWHNKFCDLRDFVKHEWHDGVPFYEAARRCITKDELPQLYRMLQDKDWAPYWHIIAKTIGYVSFEADSVEGDSESTAVLLDYFERDEVWNFTHVEKVSGKVRALGWIGLSGGPEADLVLRKAVTKEGALELAKNWINQEWEFPDSTAWSETEYLASVINGEAFKGLVWTGKPENIERVEKLWSEQQAYVRDYPDLVTAFGMRVYSELCDAVSIHDAIADIGREAFFCTLGDPTEQWELLGPYIRKRQQAQAQPVIDERLRDPAEFVKQDWDWYGGVSFYEAARRCITKDKLPLLYEMLQDRNYAAHWHRIARTICFASDRDDAANSVGVLLDYLQRDDVWNLTDSGKIMGKVGVMCLMGIIGGPEVDSVLRKAVTLEGAAELVKNWIDKKRPIVPESDSWNRAEFVRTMIRGEASRGLGLTGDPANNEFLWKLVAEQRDWYKENPDYTVTYSDKDQEASPCGTFWDSVIDGLANYALVVEMGRREAYLIMGNHEALDAKRGPHSRRLAREVREMLRGGNANAEPVEHTGTPAGPTQTEGISGSAYYFDGEGDFINIEDSPSLDISGSQITVSAWIRPEKIDTRQVIVAKTAGGDNTWLVEINPVDFGPGTINFYMDIEGMDGNFGSRRPVQVGRWHHVACVYDGTQRVIYIDGRFDASQAVSGSLQTNDQPVRIGSWGSLSRFFHGTIDEVLIYSRALSAREIQELHQRVDRAGDNKVGLVGYWSFNADEEGIVKDSSGHHNHGRLNNGRQTLGVRIPARRSSSRTDGRVEFALAAEAGVGDKRMMAARAIENGAGSELVDLYGDSLPTGAIARLGTRRLRHMDEAASVAFSPDGKTIASAGGGEGVVAVWETATGKKLHWLIGHSHGADAVAFAANGKMLASGSGSTGQVILWDPIGGTKLRELEHDCSVFSLTFSPDCNVLAAVSGYSRTTGRLRGRGRIYLWDPATGVNILTIVEPGAYWAAFTPDAARIISANQNRNSSRVAVWDTGTGEEIRAFDDTKICSVGLSPDGKTLAAGYEDGSVRVWDVDSGATRFELPASGSDSRSAEQVVFSPNGRVLALAIDAGRNSILRAIEVETGKELWTGKMRVRSVAFSPDGRMLASCSHDGRIRLWNATDGQEITKAPSHYRQVQLAAFSADGQTVTTKAKDGTVRTWDTTGGGQQSMFNVVVPYWNDALSDHGLLLATIDEDKSVLICEAQTGKVIHRLQCFQDFVGRLAFEPGAKDLATLEESGVVRLWDIAAGKERLQFQLPDKGRQVIVFSPDGGTLALGGIAGMIRMDREGTRQLESTPLSLWDTTTGTELAKLGTGQDPVASLAFSPDGRLLAVAQGQLSGIRGTGRSGSTISPDSSNTVRLWQVKSGRQLANLRHPSDVFSVAFSPDGDIVASGSKDGRVRLWAVGSGRQIAELEDYGWQTRNGT